MNRFIDTVWTYYRANKRDMPWRTDTRPYYVVVSEIMLQQTQIDRVMKKFPHFIERFPDWHALAKASVTDVLHVWSGLGYNRRALFLKRIAETITNGRKTSGELPRTYEALRELPGIGPNTAGSILAFAYNIPHPFIETNIRSVFIHFFFSEIEKREGRKACKKISDTEIMPLIEKALAHPRNAKNPREWHYALMDYGAYLKKIMPNPSRKSVHHMKQSPFKGSNRELRSRILKLIMEKPMKATHIFEYFKKEKVAQTKLVKNLQDLVKEGFLKLQDTSYSIK